jgi:hypothetical protein
MEGQMARRNKDEFAEMPGQDSFLDVLTNMVGIIILLVVVVGIRTSRATIQKAIESVSAIDDSEERVAREKLEQAKRAALVARSELNDRVQQAVEIRNETALREQERDYLSTFAAAVEEELNARRAELTSDKQSDYDVRRKLAESKAKLEKLGREQLALLAAPAEVEAIQNQPTPMAHRASGRRVVLYLSEGHVAVLPLEQVSGEIAADARENIWRLKDSDSYIGIVGPIGGFRYRYVLASTPVDGRSPAGAYDRGVISGHQSTRVISLIGFQVLPERSPTGESIADAIKPNSELHEVLRDNPSDMAYILISVCTNSIRELHELKAALYAEGYAIAETPRPENRPFDIAVGRSRYRSSSAFTQ